MEPLAGGAEGSFAWRVGIAFYKADAPFSAFVGIDRWIALLRGKGIAMRTPDGAIDRKLQRPLEPFAFPGEAKIDSNSLGGECELFNVLTTRGRFKATVSPIDTGVLIPASESVLMVYCVTRPYSIAIKGQSDLVLQPGQAALWRAGVPEVSVESLGHEPSGLLVRIEPDR